MTNLLEYVIGSLFHVFYSYTYVHLESFFVSNSAHVVANILTRNRLETIQTFRPIHRYNPINMFYY
jgi:hypothetical protein